MLHRQTHHLPAPRQEYNGCSPRRVRVSIVVNFQREGDTTASQFDKLKKLFKQVGQPACSACV